MSIDAANAQLTRDDIVRDTLRSILSSPHFARSKRYPAFLEYVVTNTLEGKDDTLNERLLASEVFGRSLDYDSGSDSVVRVAAGEVRKRLAQYFNEHPDAPVRIDLPIGSYAAEFHFSPTATAGTTTASPLNPRESIAPDLEEAPEQVESAKYPRSPKAYWVFGATAAVILIVSVAVWNVRKADPLRTFWQPLLPDGQPALILPGKIPNYSPGPGVGQQLGSNPNFYARSVLSLEDAIVLARVCSFFREYHHDCNIAEASTMPLEDITGKSLALVGGFNNVWMMKLLAPLPYQLEYFPGASPGSAGTRSVVEHKPSGNTPLWTTREGDTGSQAVVDYVILSRFHSEITDSMVVAIAGLHPAATIGGAEYLSSPERIAQLFSQAPKDWKGVNFQAVLQIDVMAGSPGRPTVVAARYW